MGGKGVEPLRTFVHTVLSRARLPFRHPPITKDIIEFCANFYNCFILQGTAPARPIDDAVRPNYAQCSRPRLFLSNARG